ncbi:hypothetical protein [Desulforhabdus sp. TSK]|nr:hypothetical protein [Desulforhabdus sp. TSK]
MVGGKKDAGEMPAGELEGVAAQFWRGREASNVVDLTSFRHSGESRNPGK